MKLFSKKVVVVLTIVLLQCSCFSVFSNVAAAGTGVCEKGEETPILSGENALTPEQLLVSGFQGRYVHSAAEELTADTNGDARAMYGHSGFYVTLDVPVETQVNGYFCGPATVIQNLKYISDNQFTWTQYEVAEAIGTTNKGSSSSTMMSFMNNQITRYGYSIYNYATIDINASTFDEDFYVDTIYSNCSYYDWPAFGSFHLQTSAGGQQTAPKWPYSTNGGHFLSYSGVDIGEDYNNIRFTDCYYLRKFSSEPESNAHYWVNASVCLETIRSFIW